MHLNLSTEELRDLMEMASMAIAIADSEREESDPRFAAWAALYNRILTLANQDKALAPAIDYPDEHGNLSLTPAYIENSYLTEKLNQFTDHQFWSELVLRLADKALEDHLGEDQFDELTEEERRALTEPLEQSFWQECTTYGIDRLGFILPPSGA